MKEFKWGDSMQGWYEKLYVDVKNSSTYSEYCKRAFGLDLSQQGFGNKDEIDFVLRILQAGSTDRILDIGCGSGGFDKYIQDVTGAFIIGIDYSKSAIRIAKERYAKPDSMLSFICTNMDDMTFGSNTLDAVIAMDTLFFSSNMPKLIRRIEGWLKKGGRFVTAYSEICFDEDLTQSALEADSTEVAIALQNAKLPYIAHDVTENLYKHMVLKYRTAQELKKDFIAEGNDYIYNYIIRESFPPERSFENFQRFQKRYIYVFEKT